MKRRSLLVLIVMMVLLVRLPEEAPAKEVLKGTGMPRDQGQEMGWINEFEYNHSAFRYLSPTTFLTVNYKLNGKGGWYFLTHVIVKDARQLNGAQSFRLVFPDPCHCKGRESVKRGAVLWELGRRQGKAKGRGKAPWKHPSYQRQLFQVGGLPSKRRRCLHRGREVYPLPQGHGERI